MDFKNHTLPLRKPHDYGICITNSPEQIFQTMIFIYFDFDFSFPCPKNRLKKNRFLYASFCTSGDVTSKRFLTSHFIICRSFNGILRS